MLPTKFISFGQAVSDEKLFRNRTIGKRNCLWRPCLLTNQNGMSKPYRGPSIDASYQVSIHMAKLSQRRFFLNRPIRNNNCLWWPCLLMDQNKMCNLYRGPAIDASYQVSIHLAQWFQRRFFRNELIRNKNCLWRPCLLRMVKPLHFISS